MSSVRLLTPIVLIAFAERHPQLVARKNRDFWRRTSKEPGLLKKVAVLGTNDTIHMTHFSTNAR